MVVLIALLFITNSKFFNNFFKLLISYRESSGGAKLDHYAILENVTPFKIGKQKFEITELESRPNESPQLFTDDIGLYIKLIDGLGTEIYFGYTINFEYKGKYFRLEHNAVLNDWKSPYQIYLDYYDIVRPNEDHPASINLKNLRMWLVKKLLEEFTSRFGRKGDPVSLLGRDNIIKLNAYFGVIIQYDYITP